MPRLTIILDLPGIDAAQVDPYTLTDDLLNPDLATCKPGGPILPNDDPVYADVLLESPEDFVGATFVSCEWLDTDELQIPLGDVKRLIQQLIRAGLEVDFGPLGARDDGGDENPCTSARVRGYDPHGTTQLDPISTELLREVLS